MKRLINCTIAGTALVLVPSSAYVAYKYRPRGSSDVAFHDQQGVNELAPTHFVERTLLTVAHNSVLALAAFLGHMGLKLGNEVEILHHEKLKKYVLQDRGGVGLITYSNHASVCDDPGLMTVITPLSVVLNTKRMRWSVCSDELCFPSDSPAVGALLGAGNGIPIQRGGSIYQRGVAELQRKVNKGDWVHLFAEGRVWQEGGSPSRDADGRWCSVSGRCGDPFTKVGPLKWGIGKLIANASTPAVVLPFFHWGMNDVMPQDHENQLTTTLPYFSGKKVTVAFGDPVDCRDLVETYHQQARQRALQRNTARKARLQQLQEEHAKQVRVSVSAGAAASSGGWLSWIWPGSAAPASAAQSSGLLASTKTSRPLDSRVRPVNTVEDAADHTGASAHVAGIAKPAAPEQLQQEAARQAAEQQSELDLVAAAKELEAKAVAKLESLADETRAKAYEAARDIETRAVETAKELEHRAMGTARDIELHARELVQKLRELEEKILGQVAGGAKPKQEKEAAPSRFARSVSYPAPAQQPRQVDAATAQQTGGVVLMPPEGASAHVEVPAAAPGSRAAGGPYKLPSAEVFPLSDEPVIQFIPKRELKTGVVVPSYIEQPLYAKPPDHDYLSPAEAAEEEEIRLELYSAIAARLQEVLTKLEAEVMSHRKARGIVEERPFIFRQDVQPARLPPGQQESRKVEQV